MIKLYGIPNCDTIKKARKWLSANGLEYDFHDYRKQGVPEKELSKWIKQTDWELLLNKRGTTWRKLDEETKNSIDKASATQIMLDNPSIIKRPVLTQNKTLLIGFKEDEYSQLL
ncbi:MAG TPA: ArsC family reductase [Gammaproteobacteria bacterium]|nr:ArsC family reductase [Gammaproteobacteria bacterium]